MQGLDDRLDGQIALLAPAVRPDGSIDQPQIHLLLPFDQAGGGWSWRIQAPAQTLGSDAEAHERSHMAVIRNPGEGNGTSARWTGAAPTEKCGTPAP